MQTIGNVAPLNSWGWWAVASAGDVLLGTNDSINYVLQDNFDTLSDVEKRTPLNNRINAFGSGHRGGANFQAQAEGKTSDDIVEELLKVVGEPEPAKYVAAKKKI